MRLGYELSMEQSQKLVMTPELIQAIQILQFNTQELETYVEEQLLINPILEIDGQASDEGTDSKESDYDKELESPREETGGDEEFDWAEHFKEREYDDISYKQEYNSESKEYSFEQVVSSDITLAEHLMFQLQFVPLKKNCRSVAKYMIEGLDENGYLTSDLKEIADHFSIAEKKAEEVLRVIQGFEPVGVCARNLRECLQIQLYYQGGHQEIAMTIVEDHLEDLAANRLSAIAKALNVSVKDVQEAGDLIKSLEPKPGSQFGSSQETRYIVPDVTVEKVDGAYVVTVNDSSAPRLHVSSYYRKMLINAEKESSISKFLAGRLNSALWLIKSIEQRRQTIYNVVQAIVRYQSDFFDCGPKYLKTMTLKQIADEVGIHESTVSRSINGKYMQSPRGLYELKYFFTSGVAGSTGEGIASGSIKTFIKEMVDQEDPKSPYSDQAMVQLLSQRGIAMSRRTVAKYRDEMGVPSSSKRKRY